MMLNWNSLSHKVKLYKISNLSTSKKVKILGKQREKILSKIPTKKINNPIF